MNIANRTMPRWLWRWFYRQHRIIRRETNKAAVDALIFGIGYVRTSEDGFVNHVRPEYGPVFDRISILRAPT